MARKSRAGRRSGILALVILQADAYSLAPLSGASSSGHAGHAPAAAAAATAAVPSLRQLIGPTQGALPQGRVERAQAAALALLTSTLLITGSVSPALAENELQAFAGDGLHSELVQPECFAQQCSLSTKACADNADCVKGLACTAKCLGDSQCTVGCFARYGNKALDDVLACTIEDAGCIKIAIMQPGADSPHEVPRPPKPIIASTPASLQGKWYKVMGWNPNYDCFDCQRNSFSKPSANVGAMKVGDKAVDVEVLYTMPRDRVDQPAQTFKQTLHEQLVFDTTPGSLRTAHTEGKMFGLTFWENWYILGENARNEAPFKFVYYTGKTLQNRYEGAFVYAREPKLPQSAMPAIYKLAREAGLEPTNMCVIDNKCYAGDGSSATPPPFTPVAEAAAPPAAFEDGPISPLRQLFRDLSEFMEDPRPPARAMFAKQKQMSQIREYDANGFRRSYEDAAAAAPSR